MWFALSLIALLCWSGSDLFSKIGSRPEDKYSHWKMIMAVGLVMGLHALFEIIVHRIPVSGQVFLAYLPASLLYIASMVLGYVGLRYIELSVSSPICNSSGALASLLCFLFLDQRLNIWQSGGVILVALGVVGLGLAERGETWPAKVERRSSQGLDYSRSALALAFPLFYCLLDAAGTFVDAFILETLAEEAANVAYELTFFLMGLVAYIYVCRIKGEPLFRREDRPKLIAALFETGGQFAYIFAIAANAVAAAPVISAYCAASVLWSRLFLKEKLSCRHYAAIAVTIVGIIVLGVFE